MRNLQRGIIIAVLIVSTACSNRRVNVSEKPNILVIMGNDISYPHMEAYGTPWVKTPGFNRVADEGMLFSNAYTPSSESAPSVACFLTGRNPWQLGEAANNYAIFPGKYKSFIEILSRNGYYTGYTGKGWAPGIAIDSTGNDRMLTGKAYNEKKTTAPTSGISDIDYNANFVSFLDARQDKTPFCFWFGSLEADRKYEFGSGVVKGGKSTADITKVPGFWPDNETVRNDMLDYAFETEYFDKQLTKMLNTLEERGELDNTVIIITSDNGMPFPRAEGQAYEYSNHVPLAIMWKKGIRNPGRIIRDFVSSIDFAPTLLEAAGINIPGSGMQPVQGKSLMNIFRSLKKGWIEESRNQVLIGRERNNPGRPGDAGYPVRGLVKDGFLYLINYKPDRWPSGNPETGYTDTDDSPTKSSILDMQGKRSAMQYLQLNFGTRYEEELYLLSEDPECITNLALDPGYNPVKRRLHEELYLELLQQDDPRMYGKGDAFDDYPYSDTNLSDFYEKFLKGEIKGEDAFGLNSSEIYR
jgi:arylsulfatase A-like enzyme